MIAWGRVDRVIGAVLSRISDRGDMPIRVSCHTMAVLRFALGIRNREDQEAFREVDAAALEMLVAVVQQRRVAVSAFNRRFQSEKGGGVDGTR